MGEENKFIHVHILNIPFTFDGARSLNRSFGAWPEIAKHSLFFFAPSQHVKSIEIRAVSNLITSILSYAFLKRTVKL